MDLDSWAKIVTDDVEMQTSTNAHSEFLYPELQKFKNYAVEMITGTLIVNNNQPRLLGRIFNILTGIFILTQTSQNPTIDNERFLAAVMTY